jgi:hypothetical protein
MQKSPLSGVEEAPMALLCPKCGQHEVSPQQPRCPGGCDLTDYWAQVVASAEGQAVPVAVEGAQEAGEFTCPGCHAPLNPDARFCDHCGWPVVPHCPTCGADNRIGAQFCRACGVRLSGSRPERRGRTRFCPTCGQPMTGQPGVGRRTETMPAHAAPRLPAAEVVIPSPPPEPVTETPVVAPAAATPTAPTVEMVPVEQAVPMLESHPVEASLADESPVQAEELPVQETVPLEEPQPEESAQPRQFDLAVIRRDGSTVVAFPLKEGDNLIGVKIAGSGVIPVVDLGPCDPRKVISRRHAILRVIGERLLLADCGSTNGTEVNGEPITKAPVQVTEQSEIAFAGLRCRLRVRERS